MEQQKPLHLWPLVVLGILQSLFPPEPEPGVQKAVVELTVLVIGIGLAAAAGYLLAKRNKNIAQDDKPTTLATRGSFAPVIKGRRRVGPIFTWAGDRFSRKEKAKGGKGSIFSQKQDVWRENAMHVLCVGPVKALWNIEQGGEPLFVGPITAESHPSGSTIDLGNEGSFRIFWGEVNQPVNLFMGDASRVGISSRWPQFCYVEWREKRLGTSPTWPLLTYLVETRPTDSPLVATEGYIEATATVGGTSYDVHGRLNGASGVGYLQIETDVTSLFYPTQRIQVQGNTGLGVDTDFTILLVEPFVEVLSTYTTPLGTTIERTATRTRLFFEEALSGATVDGTIVPYILEDSDYSEGRRGNDGWNPAHMIAETLFGAWPIGLELDQDDWDMDSLEALGTLLGPDGEDLRGSMIAPDGQNADGTLAAWMQDFGVFISLNMRTGLLEFVPIREPEGTLVDIPDHAILSLPEIETRHSTHEVDRIVFSFPDEANSFRDMTIGFDNDGQATFQQFFRARAVQIVNTAHFKTAAKISERRSYEEMSGGSDIKIRVGREGRTLLPGRAAIVAGFDEVLRLTNVRPDPESNDVELTFLPDFYGSPLSDFITGQGNTGSASQPVAPDLLGGIIEIPEVVIGAGGPITIVPVGIRAHDTISGHNIHLSRDDTTYTFIGDDSTIVTGGTLLEAVAEEWEQAEGPTFTLLGDDSDAVLDLSADSVSWRGGRQLAVLVKENGEQEICFLEKITNVSGSTYRLDGLIRARYDTRPLDWEAGDRVFILQDDDGLPIQDVLLEPQVTLWEKNEPLGAGSLTLAQIPAVVRDLYGKGIRPVTPSGVRLDAESSTLWNSRSYVLTGAGPADDLIVIWAYSVPQSPAAGAGFFAAGAAIADPDPEGAFSVEILDSGDNVVRTEASATNSYTYARANRIADFSGEPSLFKVRVTQLRGGYASDSVTTTFTNET